MSYRHEVRSNFVKPCIDKVLLANCDENIPLTPTTLLTAAHKSHSNVQYGGSALHNRTMVLLANEKTVMRIGSRVHQCRVLHPARHSQVTDRHDRLISPLPFRKQGAVNGFTQYHTHSKNQLSKRHMYLIQSNHGVTDEHSLFSDKVLDFFSCVSDQNGSEDHPTSYPMRSRDAFPRNKRFRSIKRTVYIQTLK
jgi:hypothetical protein